MKFISLFCLLLSGLFGSGAAEARPATAMLFQQITQLDAISPYVERIDLARLLVIRSAVQAVAQDMERNVRDGKSEVTFQTLRLIQNLIVQYRFSQVFFGWTEPRSINSIYTDATKTPLAKLKELADGMVVEYGYDDSPYTQITANTFRQMQRLLKQLEDLPLDPSFAERLRALWMPIGETIAIAEQGDRPRAFEKAIAVVQAMRDLYPMFDEVSSSSAGFQMVLELQGLTEFYAEYAQVNK